MISYSPDEDGEAKYLVISVDSSISFMSIKVKIKQHRRFGTRLVKSTCTVCFYFQTFVLSWPSGSWGQLSRAVNRWERMAMFVMTLMVNILSKRLNRNVQASEYNLINDFVINREAGGVFFFYIIDPSSTFFPETGKSPPKLCYKTVVQGPRCYKTRVLRHQFESRSQYSNCLML